mgnify:CR=1 FL=1
MITSLLFPPKCVFCRKLLVAAETDICHECRRSVQQVITTETKLSNIAQWTAVWYYKKDVRNSIRRFKFSNARGYADVYAKHLAIKLMETNLADCFDLLTWVPVSLFRRITRGYDQSQLLAEALGKELSCTPIRLLRKIRHTSPQSQISKDTLRKKNVEGAYKACNSAQIAGKRILLLDDIITSGFTAEECAKVLAASGAKQVFFAAVAAANHKKNK